MSDLVLLLVTGLGLGALYFIAASGLSLIYGLMGVLNFAHGVFMTAGAYGATMAGTYNSRPLTPEVLVSGNKWSVVRARQPLEALIKADNLPPWLVTETA